MPFFFKSYSNHRDLHSFPTRRSSDLGKNAQAEFEGEIEKPFRRDVVNAQDVGAELADEFEVDRKSTRLNSSHRCISYAVFCLKKKRNPLQDRECYQEEQRGPHEGLVE